MGDIDIRVTGRAGRITLTRPKALNALTYAMCMAIDAALRKWRDDDAVALVIIDAEGDKAFCAGGDIAQLYETGIKGDYEFGRTFWRDEYRMNALVAEYAKPIVSFMQGFTMGGGVGIGCHGSHRVVEDSSRIAMPECGIGLVPDVGGSYLLAKAPDGIGAYLGLTAQRMRAADAILAGFADLCIPRTAWGELIADLETGADLSCIAKAAKPAEGGGLAALAGQIEQHFTTRTLGEILASLRASDSEFAQDTLRAMERNSPLSMACTLSMLQHLRDTDPTMRNALAAEYRFTWRAMEHGDLLEGIRAAIIDKDRTPRWQFSDMVVPARAVENMLEPLGADELTFEERRTT